MTTITNFETKLLPVEKLERHPSNRPLGLNLEKVEQIKSSITQYGFYGNQPLVVRPVNGHYQIIKGEHRFVAAKELGYDELPCSVQDMNDDEALVQLIIGNIQTENKPLEIGLNAMEFISLYERGSSAKDYAEKTGVNQQSLSRYILAAKVYRYLLNHINVDNILREDYKLAEIGRCLQDDWLWLHDIISKDELSTKDTVTVCKSVRSIDDAIAYAYMLDLLDTASIKQKVAREILNGGKSKTLTNTLALISAVEESYNSLDGDAILYKYDLETDEIKEAPANLQAEFIDALRKQQSVTPQIVNKIALDLLDKKERYSLTAANATAGYYRNERNQQEAESKLKIEQSRRDAIAAEWLAGNDYGSISKLFDVTELYVEESVTRFRAQAGRAATFEEMVKQPDGKQAPGFEVPLYNVWTYAKLTNEVSHFGNSEQRIVENLLYLYTQPFDVVLDTFGGGGSTIDVCRRRYRRYWVSDRLPIPDREHEIRKHDLTDGLPDIGDLWNDVTLTYLDPPYWRQAAGQYSNDPTDLANMPLEDFTKAMVDLVKGIASKQSKGVIALIIQPTQWKSDGKQFADHVLDIVSGVGNKKLVLENRVSCPYSTEQYNAQQVTWAKENKKLLVVTRELIIWRIV